MINTQIIDTLTALEPHADAWNRLCLEVPQKNPVLSHAWVASHLEHRLRPGESWFCVLAWQEARLVGVLPLIAQTRRFAGREQRILRAPADGHTDSGDALMTPGRERDVLPELVAAAARHYPRHLCIELTRVPEVSATAVLATDGSQRRKATIRTIGQGHYLPISGSFDDYRASLSSHFRSNLNYRANRLKKLPDVTEQFISGGDATEAMLTNFMEVEAKSWKGREGTAILSSSELVAFYTTLTRRLAATGWLEWHLLNVGDKTIAANLAIRLNDAVVVWKLGYDADYAKYSPGNMLFERLIRRAHEVGDIKEINLLTEQPWHERWLVQCRTYHLIRFYPPRPVAWLAWAVEAARLSAGRNQLLRRAWTRLRTGRQPPATAVARS